MPPLVHMQKGIPHFGNEDLLRLAKEQRLMRRQLNKTLSLALAIFLFSVPVHAGDSWFSGVYPNSRDRNLTVFGALELTTAGDSTSSVFDIVISLEADPQ